LKHLHSDREGGIVTVQLAKDRVLHPMVGGVVVTLANIYDGFRAEYCEERLWLDGSP